MLKYLSNLENLPCVQIAVLANSNQVYQSTKGLKPLYPFTNSNNTIMSNKMEEAMYVGTQARYQTLLPCYV